MPSHLRSLLATRSAGLLLALALATLALGATAGCSKTPERSDALARQGAPPTGDVAHAVLEAVRIPDSLERVAALASLLSTLGPEAVPQVRDAFDYAYPILGDAEWMLLADWWTRFDDRAAWSWVQQRREYKSAGVLRYIVHGMARRDPHRALATLLTIRLPEERDAAFAEIVKGWYEAGGDGLLDHLIGMQPGSERQRAIALLVGLKLRREGIEATRDWAESLDDDLAQRFKLQVYRRVASELAFVDPAAARDWAEAHVDGPNGSGLYRRVAVSLAESDPRATLEWLRGLPDGPERDDAVSEAYRRWLTNDRDAAIAWMNGAETEPWRQPALELRALAETRDDPKKALELTRLLESPERRLYAQVKIGIAWLTMDPTAARAWLEGDTVAPDVKQKILDRLANSARRARKAG